VTAVLIRGARLVDPEAGVDGRRDLLASAGRVALVAESISPPELDRVLTPAERRSMRTIRAEGLWLWPGPIDPHVHFRDPGFTHKETLRTGAEAAAGGGYTSVICEPNTEPPLDSASLVAALAERARAEAAVHVYFKAAMTVGRFGREPSDIPALAREPAVRALSDDGDPVVDPAVMERVCRLAAQAGLLLSPHCEDSPASLRRVSSGVSPGFEPGEPYTNEARYIARDLEMAGRAGCRIHFSHVSLAASIEAIRRHRERHDPGSVTFEVTPHHLLLSTEDFGPGRVPKVNPPLRSPADRDALRDALLAGTVDMIATDHAPHTPADKEAGASGLVGLETALGLVLTHLVGEGMLSVKDAVRLMSAAPARVFGVPGGTLRPGSMADMVLIDPGAEWTVEPGGFRSKSRNTAFAGWRLRGRPVATFVDGRPVYAAPDLAAREEGGRP